MSETVQFPENLFDGVAKFGGILAALRGMMIVMLLINRRQFEKKVTKFLLKEKAKAEDPQDTSAPAGFRSARDIKRKFSIQEEHMNVTDSLLNESSTVSQMGLPTAEEGEIKKRYSIEMFEDLIQTVIKLKKRVSELESAVMH
jgi:hypothetical protein